MKLRIILGLLLAGSLFVGTAVQAQDNDLTAEDLDALEQAQEAVKTATTAEERQKAEENLQQLEDELQEVTRQEFVPGIGNVAVVSVECHGNCNDSTLGQICGQVGMGFRPFAVDCVDVATRGQGAGDCPGGGNNICSRFGLERGQSLGEYCDDTDGWDAHVYCRRRR